MNDPEAESMSNEELLRHVRELRDKLKPYATQWREMGFEVDSFLEDCERLIAFVEGRSEEWMDVAEFLEKINAFSKEMSAFCDIQRQAERIKTIASIPGMLDVTEKLAKNLSNPNDAPTAAALKASVEAARQRLARGEVPLAELEDISLSAQAQKAELSRRSQFQAATLALFWESRPPEWWAKRTDKERKELGELLAQWRAEREKILSELPIADRRRLEALRPEDFDKPGALDP
jgi:hypothetical protein